MQIRECESGSGILMSGLDTRTMPYEQIEVLLNKKREEIDDLRSKQDQMEIDREKETTELMAKHREELVALRAEMDAIDAREVEESSKAVEEMQRESDKFDEETREKLEQLETKRDELESAIRDMSTLDAGKMDELRKVLTEIARVEEERDRGSDRFAQQIERMHGELEVRQGKRHTEIEKKEREVDRFDLARSRDNLTQVRAAIRNTVLMEIEADWLNCQYMKALERPTPVTNDDHDHDGDGQSRSRRRDLDRCTSGDWSDQDQDGN